MSTPLTAAEIQEALKGETSQESILALFSDPEKNALPENLANLFLDYYPRTAEILERMVAEGICKISTNRWFPSQYRDLKAALAAPEFEKIRNLVRMQDTGASIRMSDAQTGNVVLATISSPTAEAIRAAVKTAKKQMAEQKKATALRIAGERIANSM